MSETWASAPLISRRTALFGGSVLLLTASSFLPASAVGENLLDRLRRQKVVKVGIANAPPFSAMRPDGSMTGVGPTMARRVLERLGIPQMEGAIATYGELIPGMMAGRWDFIAAAMTMTKERCKQVLFADPMTFEGPCIVAAGTANPGRPQTIADLARLKVMVGALSGGAQYRQLVEGGVLLEKISQFANENNMIDGLIAGRVQFLYVTHLLITEVSKRRKIAFDVVFPVSDAAAPGASNVFRQEDVEFHAAYQRELRALKTTGEFQEMARQFGFEIPEGLTDATSERQCSL